MGRTRTERKKPGPRRPVFGVAGRYTPTPSSALRSCRLSVYRCAGCCGPRMAWRQHRHGRGAGPDHAGDAGGHGHRGRSEEHTSELQSLMRISYAVFCLKKKKYEMDINMYN